MDFINEEFFTKILPAFTAVISLVVAVINLVVARDKWSKRAGEPLGLHRESQESKWSLGQKIRLFFHGGAIIYPLWVCSINVAFLRYFEYFDFEQAVAEVNYGKAIKYIVLWGAVVLVNLVLFVRVLREPKRGGII